jgi:sugar lactone lactonase YvrE
LYFSDFHTHRVLAVDLEGHAETIAHVPGQPAGLGWLADGRLLIASMRDRKVLRQEKDGRLSVHADLMDWAPWHVNDMLVDQDGRAWVGNFGFDLHGGAPLSTTALHCVEPDGTVHVAAEDLGFPNGTVLMPDGKSMVIAETTMNRLTAFTVKDGVLSDRREWARFGPPPASRNIGEAIATLDVLPDGICLDAEGAIWVTDPIHARILRVTEGGRIEAELPTGIPVFACMLGGNDGCTLFACVAPSFDERECAANHQASIVMTRVEVPRAGLP